MCHATRAAGFWGRLRTPPVVVNTGRSGSSAATSPRRRECQTAPLSLAAPADDRDMSRAGTVKLLREPGSLVRDRVIVPLKADW